MFVLHFIGKPTDSALFYKSDSCNKMAARALCLTALLASVSGESGVSAKSARIEHMIIGYSMVI